ncbi:hypothetical protein [Streptomyces sp. NPDC059009]|uniref:hypothetical protein n=1 Tax=Streptomyces sp. NPDC059009 TaxID=3346694 RepID=UPI00368EF59B
MTRRLPHTLLKAGLAGSAATLLLGLAAPYAHAEPARPTAPSAANRSAAHEAATAPATLDTLSRFFARDGAVSRTAAHPRVEGAAVPVYYLSPEFVAGKKDAPVGRLQFLASEAVSADGQRASLWTAKQGTSWKVVNIATGDDETRYARAGAKKLPGGTVFHEPQINAWYVQARTRVLPLDADAVRAIGARGTSVAAYQKRVHKEYGDKLPGSGYAKSGKAGGFGARPSGSESASSTGTSTDGPLTVVSAVAGVGAAVALGLSGIAVLRRRSRRLG